MKAGNMTAKGILTGEYKSFDREGNLVSVQKVFTKGLLNGTCTEYFSDGKIQVQRIYEQDTLKRIESFDSKGNSLYVAEKSGNEIYSKSLLC